MQSSWGLASLSDHKEGYGLSIFAAGEPSILKMQIPWDEQQEQEEQESGVNQTLEW